MRVLLCEPDAAMAQVIERRLKDLGFIVYTTDLGEEAFELARLYDYDVVLTELVLPDVAGVSLVRRMRDTKIKAPVLVVSSLDGTEDKVKALSAGADDYVTKPFNMREMVARIHAVVRRYRGHAQSLVVLGALTVDLDLKVVTIAGKPVHLSLKEYSLLEVLALRQGSTVTKEMILNHLYGGMDEPDVKIVDVFLWKIRKKLAEVSGGESFIYTIYGRGYTLRLSVALPVAA
jgi:two-component system cell cycle response regulator CtrA